MQIIEFKPSSAKSLIFVFESWDIKVCTFSHRQILNIAYMNAGT